MLGRVRAQALRPALVAEPGSDQCSGTRRINEGIGCEYPAILCKDGSDASCLCRVVVHKEIGDRANPHVIDEVRLRVRCADEVSWTRRLQDGRSEVARESPPCLGKAKPEIGKSPLPAGILHTACITARWRAPHY